MDMLINVVLPLVLYILLCYPTYVLAQKFGTPYAWMAFIPLINIYLMAKMADKSGWSLLWLLVPIGNIIYIIRILHTFSTKTGHGGWWTAGMVVFGAIFIPLTALKYQAPADASGVVQMPAWSNGKVAGYIAVIVLLPLLQMGYGVWSMKQALESGSFHMNMSQLQEQMEQQMKESAGSGDISVIKQGYDEKSKQVENISHLTQIKTALMVHNMDMGTYPEPENGCLPNSITKDGISEESLINTDSEAVSAPCTLPGKFGYGVRKDEKGNAIGYYITAKMSTTDGGNYAGDTSEYHEDMKTASRGAGDMYVVTD